MKINLEDLESYDELLDDNEVNVTNQFCRKTERADYFAGHYEDESPFGGTMNKVFLRCDSKYFSDLISLLMDNDCSYVTHLNDLCKSLKTSQTMDFPLSKISVLLKDVHGSINPNVEEVCSRVANALGVPTVYNKTVNLGRYKDYVMSVDCLKNGQEICDDFHMRRFSEFDSANRELRLALNRFRRNGTKIPNKQIEKLMQEYLKTYIYRQFIVCDSDYNGNNCNLVYNLSNNEYSWFPNFDYEYCFKKISTGKRIEIELKKIEKLYPQMLAKVICDFRLRVANINKLMEDSDASTHHIYEYVLEQLNRVLEVYSSMNLETKNDLSESFLPYPSYALLKAENPNDEEKRENEIKVK